jgi:hypothetical protein
MKIVTVADQEKAVVITSASKRNVAREKVCMGAGSAQIFPVGMDILQIANLQKASL